MLTAFLVASAVGAFAGFAHQLFVDDGSGLGAGVVVAVAAAVVGAVLAGTAVGAASGAGAVCGYVLGRFGVVVLLLIIEGE